MGSVSAYLQTPFMLSVWWTTEIFTLETEANLLSTLGAPQECLLLPEGVFLWNGIAFFRN